MLGCMVSLTVGCSSPQPPRVPESDVNVGGSPDKRPSSTLSPESRSRPVPSLPLSMFVGGSLGNWQVVREADFEHHGQVQMNEEAIVLDAGNPATGIRWIGGVPREGYEVTLEAMRVEGSDFFCGMTFPVGDSHCTWIVGGWGGSVVGLSNIDDQHAAENATTSGMMFDSGRWYRLRLRVTPAKIEAWIDGVQKVDQEREGHRFSIWAEQYPVRPFGIATWYTKAALRNMVVKDVGTEP